MRIQCLNPATGQPFQAYATMPDDEVAAIATQCQEAFRNWRRLTVAERAPHFRRLAVTLRADSDRLSKLMTLEMGKPIVESRGEIEKCAWLCDVYAERAAAWLSEQGVAADGRKHVVVHEPLGVILSIMPWNFSWSVDDKVVTAKGVATKLTIDSFDNPRVAKPGAILAVVYEYVDGKSKVTQVKIGGSEK